MTEVELIRAYRMDRRRLDEDILFSMGRPAEKDVLEAIRSEVTEEDLKRRNPEFKGLLSQTEALRKIARAVLKERNK